MAGLRGKQAWVAAGKQTAKGTPAAAAKHMWPFSGGNIQPTRTTDHLQETDNNRQQGNTYLKSSGVEGTPEVYVRDNSIDFLLGAALGAVADSGSAPNYMHTITDAASLPYLTFWRMIGGVLFEEFDDVKVSELVVRAGAGEPLTAALTVMGLKPTRLTSDPSSGWSSVTLENGAAYTYNDAAVTLDGGSTAEVSSFELTINNNISVQQTDDAVPYDVVEGDMEISLAFDLIFSSLNEYNLFHYGTTTGTSVVNTVQTVAANFTFSKGANNSVAFDFPSIAYEEFPVEPHPDGSPVVVSVRASAQRNAPFMTATVKNQKATTF